jgi:hypothetical protein
MTETERNETKLRLNQKDQKDDELFWSSAIFTGRQVFYSVVLWSRFSPLADYNVVAQL